MVGRIFYRFQFCFIEMPADVSQMRYFWHNCDTNLTGLLLSSLWIMRAKQSVDWVCKIRKYSDICRRPVCQHSPGCCLSAPRGCSASWEARASPCPSCCCWCCCCCWREEEGWPPRPRRNSARSVSVEPGGRTTSGRSRSSRGEGCTAEPSPSQGEAASRSRGRPADHCSAASRGEDSEE